jgi:hypothetical protein
MATPPLPLAEHVEEDMLAGEDGAAVDAAQESVDDKILQLLQDGLALIEQELLAASLTPPILVEGW